MIKKEFDLYNTYDVQRALLEMMKDIHGFLESRGVAYSLSSGTLLGAIRHDGFIPWDDDVDLMMDRRNYSKFLAVCDELAGYDVKRELWILRIQKADEEKTAEYIPTIDVFVIDNAPDSAIAQNCKVLLLKLLQGMMKKKPEYKNKNVFWKICLFVTHLLGLLFTDNLKWWMYEKVSQIGNKRETKQVGCYNDLFRLLHLKYDRDLMNNLQNHVFEDAAFPIVTCYDSYLTIVYGDYMTPPAEKDRVPEHIAP